jgi:hypothetical protein
VGVSVFRPDGTLLIKDLNLRVLRASRLLVTGPNGYVFCCCCCCYRMHIHTTHTHTHTHTHYRCGKTSLFRIIRKLWPLVTGTIRMPSDKDIYFLSQVAFVPQGTLRDLVRWPLCGCVWSDGSCVVGSQLCGQILFHTPMHARAHIHTEREREREGERHGMCVCVCTHTYCETWWKHILEVYFCIDLRSKITMALTWRFLGIQCIGFCQTRFTS